MSKWERASTIINDVRANYSRSQQIMAEYGMQETYNDSELFYKKVESGVVPEHLRTLFFASWVDWAPMSFWNLHKQVYTMHPGMTRELQATGIDDKIPGAVLQALPHPNPLFVFPEGIDLTMSDNKPGRMVAFLVCGATIFQPGAGRYVSTDDPNANGLYLIVITQVHNENGTIVDWDYCHTAIPVNDTFTIRELINKDQPRYSFTDIAQITTSNEKDLSYSQQVTSIALAHLLYAVSSDADIDRPRTATTATSTWTQRAGGAPKRPVKHRPVGYVVGAALDAQRRDTTPTTPPSGSSGRTVRPHVRRAHFRTVRYGPGRSQSYVRWFPPIPVKMEGPAQHPTIHGY